MNLSSNDPLLCVLLTLRDDLYNELLFVVLLCCSQYVSSSHVHRLTPLYSNKIYSIWLAANRAFSSRSLAHGESPFHSSFRTSSDCRVIWGRPNCSMVYDEDTVAWNAANCGIPINHENYNVRDRVRISDITYLQKHLHLSMRDRRQGHPRNCFRRL
jgi:hypothetical protein